MNEVFSDGLRIRPEFKEKLMTGLGNLKEDIKQNPTKFAMMGSTAPLRGGALDDAYLASRRAQPTLMQLHQKSTNFPKPMNYINNQIENFIKPEIAARQAAGDMEGIRRLAREWARLVRQRATL